MSLEGMELMSERSDDTGLMLLKSIWKVSQKALCSQTLCDCLIIQWWQELAVFILD